MPAEEETVRDSRRGGDSDNGDDKTGSETGDDNDSQAWGGRRWGGGGEDVLADRRTDEKDGEVQGWTGRRPPRSSRHTWEME